jgi:hypothetical protein
MPQTPESTPASDVPKLAFARLPRPQKVLDLSPKKALDLSPKKILDLSSKNVLDLKYPQKVLDSSRMRVPTKSLLMQAQMNSRISELAIVYPQSQPPTSLMPAPPTPVPAKSKKSIISAQSEIDFGTFTQNGVDWLVRARRDSSMIMVKKLRRIAGLREKNILDQISHANIAKMEQFICEGDSVYLGLEYCRPTLGQILHVTQKLELQHVQHIACSVSNYFRFVNV